jgi:hypothetical protein
VPVPRVNIENNPAAHDVSASHFFERVLYSYPETQPPVLGVSQSWRVPIGNGDIKHEIQFKTHVVKFTVLDLIDEAPEGR